MSQASPIKPLPIHSKLANNPQQKPIYSQIVKNAQGQEIQLGDPAVTRGLVALMNMHAVIGGAACHWGGPAAFAEIMSALHGLMFSKDPWFEHFHFINDTGHAENGIYALRANLGYDNLSFEDLFKFRSLTSKLTGHGESHVNPEGVLISNGPLGSGVPVAQGLAMADKLMGKKRTTICTVSDGALMEGETKEALAAIPGLAKKGRLNPFLLIVSYNNTKLSGRIDADSFSMEPSLTSIASLGFKTIRVREGHDLQKVYLALAKAIDDVEAKSEEPICLIFDTIKGYGVASAEKSASGAHGFPLSKNDGKILDFINEIFKGNPPAQFTKWAQTLMPVSPATTTATSASPAVAKDKVQSGIAKGAIRAAEEGLPVYSISADLQSSTGMKSFQSKFPNNFVEVGIAESNMINVAVGMSKVGLIPIVDTFAQFGVTKGNLPLTMAALSESPVIGVFSHTGFQDAADGASHQATTYFAATNAIPYTDVVSLASSGEAEAFMYQAIKRIAEQRTAGKEAHSVLFYLGRENYPIHYREGLKYEWGKPILLAGEEDEEADLLIVATGPMVMQGLKAVEELKKQNIRAKLFNHIFVNRPDTMIFGRELEKTQNRIITVEDHQVIGGMGERLSHALSLAGHSFKIKSLGIKGHFGRSAYSSQELYDLYHIDTKDILSAAKTLLK